MSKYIKLEDAIDAVMNTEAVFADVTAEPYQKTRDVTQALHNLPTIEVSEDCISREQVRAKLDYISYAEKDPISIAKRIVEDAPSVVPSRAEGEWIIDVPPSTSHVTIYTCPFCGHEEEFEPTNYCPACGEKVKG